MAGSVELPAKLLSRAHNQKGRTVMARFEDDNTDLNNFAMTLNDLSDFELEQIILDLLREAPMTAEQIMQRVEERLKDAETLVICKLAQ